MLAPGPTPCRGRRPSAAHSHHGCSAASTDRTASQSSTPHPPPSASPQSADHPVGEYHTAPAPGTPHPPPRTRHNQSAHPVLGSQYESSLEVSGCCEMTRPQPEVEC